MPTTTCEGEGEGESEGEGEDEGEDVLYGTSRRAHEPYIVVGREATERFELDAARSVPLLGFGLGLLQPIKLRLRCLEPVQDLPRRGLRARQIELVREHPHCPESVREGSKREGKREGQS